MSEVYLYDQQFIKKKQALDKVLFLNAFNKPPILLNKGPLRRLFSLSTIGLNKFFGRRDPAFF